MIVAFLGAILISLNQWNRYLANPTVISAQRDYREWYGILPALTICYENKVDEEKAEYYIKK